MRPNSTLLREFGLPVPIDFDKMDINVSKPNSQLSWNSPVLTPHDFKNDQQALDFLTVQGRIESSAKNYKGAARGDVMADRYGQLKF